MLALLLQLHLLLLLSSYSYSFVDEPFDVRQHLATVTRYDAVRDVVDNSYVPVQIPDDCHPIHLDLVSRHGTRAPTTKRMNELDTLASSLQAHIAEAKQNGQSLEKIPAWLFGWTSPWKGKVNGGKLVVQGEDELYDHGIRLREKYSKLLGGEYHSDVFTIQATQVARTSASAVAFALALFGGRGNLGPGKNKAFSLSTATEANDILLRFYDICQTYKDYKKSEKPKVQKLKEPVFDDITFALRERYELNFTTQDISSLWFLCKQEASLLDITNQSCGLFNNSEIAFLEWTDDLESFLLKGYGNSLNYRIGVPLLQDMVQSMEDAIKANEEALPSGSYEKARLRFAHAETIMPFACLLGLFSEGSRL